ncbi:hypothetical protein CVV43_05005 [Candidatus Saccharibacteria bacterium HGW-Saccharibacteria-1]|jgi:cytoskeletal protein RodZ|nr:MAG: hypothetical protein CVV43_05005 [Candidatus Saccharibacteria bacterium HGW-Saccharibacteria-1]
MKKIKSNTGNVQLIIIVVVSLIIVGGLGFVAWKNFLQPKTITTDSKQTVTKTQATSAIDKVASWNTYSSAKYGFKVKYPADMLDVSEKANIAAPIIAAFDTNKDKNFSTDYPTLRIFQYDTTLSSKDFAASITTGDVSRKKELSLNKLDSFEHTTTLNGKELRTVFVSNGKQVISFCMSDSSAGSREDIISNSNLDQIVDTFKFTN